MQRLASGFTQRLASGLYRLGRDIFSPKARDSKPNAGFTIIEIMFVLAISGAILLSAISFLSGAEGHNSFSQSMRDMQSKIQDWLNDITTGYAGGTSANTGLNCTMGVSSGRPSFNIGGTDNAECIFLGKAIQFTDSNSPPTTNQASEIFAYSVFGLRTYTPLPPASPRPTTNLVEAAPVAAVGLNPYSTTSTPPVGDLTEEYTLGGGARVKSIVKSSNIAGDDSHIAGFYLSFNQLNVTYSGSAAVKSYQYPLSGNQYPGNDSANGSIVDQCISMTSSNCSLPLVPPTLPSKWPPPLTDWQICFANDNNSDTAVLTISSTNNGTINGAGELTKLEFKPC